jgi:hypothetical protein
MRSDPKKKRGVRYRSLGFLIGFYPGQKIFKNFFHVGSHVGSHEEKWLPLQKNGFPSVFSFIPVR